MWLNIETSGSCEHGYEPLGSIKGENLLTRWATVTFSRITLLHGVSPIRFASSSPTTVTSIFTFSVHHHLGLQTRRISPVSFPNLMRDTNYDVPHKHVRLPHVFKSPSRCDLALCVRHVLIFLSHPWTLDQGILLPNWQYFYQPSVKCLHEDG